MNYATCETRLCATTAHAAKTTCYKAHQHAHDRRILARARCVWFGRPVFVRSYRITVLIEVGRSDEGERQYWRWRWPIKQAFVFHLWRRSLT